MQNLRDQNRPLQNATFPFDCVRRASFFGSRAVPDRYSIGNRDRNQTATITVGVTRYYIFRSRSDSQKPWGATEGFAFSARPIPTATLDRNSGSNPVSAKSRFSGHDSQHARSAALALKGTKKVLRVAGSIRIAISNITAKSAQIRWKPRKKTGPPPGIFYR